MERLARNICVHICPLELFLMSMQRAAMSYGMIAILGEMRDLQSESEPYERDA